jgi:FkbM family methyltransferase
VSLLGRRVRFLDRAAFNFLFWELFIEESYGGSELQPRTIIDCGSNIGISVLFFKSLWPSAEVIAFEPSPATFAVLRDNVAELPGVTLVPKAVGAEHGVVALYTGDNSLVASTNPTRGGSTAVLVESVPLSTYIREPVDLLKMDIEGSEAAVLLELMASGTLHLVRHIFIEYHHHMPGEARTLSSFLSCLEDAGFDYDLQASIPEKPGTVQDVLIRAWRVAATPG